MALGIPEVGHLLRVISCFHFPEVCSQWHVASEEARIKTTIDLFFIDLFWLVWLKSIFLGTEAHLKGLTLSYKDTCLGLPGTKGAECLYF